MGRLPTYPRRRTPDGFNRRDTKVAEERALGLGRRRPAPAVVADVPCARPADLSVGRVPSRGALVIPPLTAVWRRGQDELRLTSHTCAGGLPWCKDERVLELARTSKSSMKPSRARLVVDQLYARSKLVEAMHPIVGEYVVT